MRMLMVSPTPKRLLTQITKIRSLILAQAWNKAFAVRSNLRNFVLAFLPKLCVVTARNSQILKICLC